MAVYSLFGTPAPAVAGADTDYTLGAVFQSTLVGSITHVRVYFDVSNTNTNLSVGVWDSGGTLLASKTVTAPVATGWTSVLLDTPVAIAANTDYTIGALILGGGYAFEAGFWPLTNAPLSVVLNGGRFIAGSTLARPTTSTNTNYSLDVVLNDALTVAAAPTKTYGGATFAERDVKTWNGTVWTTRRAKRYNGSAWG